MVRYGALLFLACASAFGQPYTISTLAGGATTGVTLWNPVSVAVDGSGDVYFGGWNGAVHKFWAKTRSLSIVAGIGVPGFSGDGGQATSAKLGRIAGIALDSAGDLYIVDVDNSRIRRVDAITGIISTIAGPDGLALPGGLAVDATNNVWFSTSWSRVQKISAGSGTVTTVAGRIVTGFAGDGGPALGAEFWDPIPSAIAPNGDLYIADYENSRIRMIAAKTGIVTSVAGSGACVTAGSPFPLPAVCNSGFSGDGGLAVNALLNYPSSVALDSAGNLYIADTLNHRIRRVDAVTGIIATIAGTGVSGFSGDNGPALAAMIGTASGIVVDEEGKIYFADVSNNRVRVLTPAGGTVRNSRPTPTQRRLR